MSRLYFALVDIESREVAVGFVQELVKYVQILQAGTSMKLRKLKNT